MRISDWSSDVCSSDLRLTDVESVWTKGIELPASALPAARADAAALKKSEFRVRTPAGYPSRVEEIARARKDKRLAPLLAAYQKAIDDDPEEANNYVNRAAFRSEEHTSELQSLMRISYAVFCLQKKKQGIRK